MSNPQTCRPRKVSSLAEMRETRAKNRRCNQKTLKINVHAVSVNFNNNAEI